MSKSIIYAGSANTQATTADGTTVQFPTIVRRYGSNLTASGGNIVAEGAGYYEGDVNLTIAGSAAGTALIQVYSNGTAVPYAYADVETTTSSVNSITIPFVIRNTCNCISNTISVIVSGVAASVTNAAIVVEKE